MPTVKLSEKVGRKSRRPTTRDAHRRNKRSLRSHRDNSPRRMKRTSDGSGVIFTLDTTTIFDKLLATLQKAHHTCARIEDKKLIWCERDSCPIWHENSKKMQAEQELKKARLESEGHTCIETMDSWPMGIVWCEKKHCIAT